MRLSRNEMLMEVAKVVATRGTCSRLKVGAIFARDGRIIGAGYNGAPAKMPHCDHSCNCRQLPYQPENSHNDFCRSVMPCNLAEHAERNGIAYAARCGVALENCQLYVTHAPCLSCAYSIVNAGIVEVYYEIPYRLTEGVNYLHKAGIKTTQMLTMEIPWD